MFRSPRFQFLLALAAILTALVFITGSVDARPSGGGSFGSRGMRTFSAPSTTRTAPNTAAPITRSMTQPGGTASTATGGAIGRSGFFGGGLFGGLAAGFLGAGLFGLLFGHGFLGGITGFASVLGLLLQIIIVVFVARLAWAWWQRRNAPATAGGPSLRDMFAPGGNPVSGGSGFADGGTVSVTKADYDAFEQLLSDVSLAYGREDLAALRSKVTPEMLSYFSEDLAKNASRGVVNDIKDIKLLQGDLAEAWREGDVEYASVAMRYSLIDRMVERASGRVVEGGDAPQQVTEVWTFLRSRGGGWILSAIQQT